MHHNSWDDVVGDEDLLTKILLRLPVKEALRCKCVCKKWKALISYPKFCYWHTLALCSKHKHGHNPYVHPSGIILRAASKCIKKVNTIPLFTNNNNSKKNNRFIHLDFHTNVDGKLRYYFVQSCNGLLLWKSCPKLYPSSPLYDELVQESSFYLTNPTTGHCLRIDHFGYDFTSSTPFLAFEPWKSPHYKIVFFNKEPPICSRYDDDEYIACTLQGLGIENDEQTTKLRVSVYSSETGSWCKHDDLLSFPHGDFVSIIKNGVYCNGDIHWYLDRTNSVYFDIDGLCFKDLHLPSLPHLPTLTLPSSYRYSFMRGCIRNLHLVADNFQHSKQLDIWELKEDYSGWIHRYHVDLTITPQLQSYQKVVGVVCQPPNEDEEEESMHAIVLVDLVKIVSYNFKNGRSTVINQGDLFYPIPSFLGLYFETLSSILPGYNN